LVREARQREAVERQPRLLERHPLPVPEEEEPEPGAPLRREEADAAVAGESLLLVEPVPEPGLVPPLDPLVEGVRPLVLGTDAELGELCERQIGRHASEALRLLRAPRAERQPARAEEAVV